MQKLTRSLGLTKNGRYYDLKKHQFLSTKERNRRVNISHTLKGIKGYFRSVAGGSFYPSGSPVPVDFKIIIITKTKHDDATIKRLLREKAIEAHENYGDAFYGSLPRIDSYEINERIDREELDEENNQELVDVLKQSNSAVGYYVSDQLTDSEELDIRKRRKKK